MPPAMLKLVARASKNLGRIAVVQSNQAYSYDNLLTAAEAISSELGRTLRGPGPHPGALLSSLERQPPRVGLYAAPGPAYLAATWAVWQAGGIVVPLATSHPPPELSYVCQDAGVSVVLAPPDQEGRLGPIARQQGAALQLLEPLTGGAPANRVRTASSTGSRSIGSSTGSKSSTLGGGAGMGRGVRDAKGAEEEAAAALADLSAGLSGSSSSSSSSSSGGVGGGGALIMYTSGTTGKPKGALHTHRSLQAQVYALCSAWRWSPSDTLLHCLPLHHIHGIVNGLYCPAAVGAAVEFMPRFAAAAVWERIQSGDVSVFMGVPTMYSHLLSHYEAQHPHPHRQEAMRQAAASLRLTVSGSSACPVPVMNRWRELSGRYLLERYGMTEIGMALSNPYEGERRPGTVGLPLPGVEVRLAGDGQLLVRGPTVFDQYWGRPEATREAFDDQGFFLTGDTASVSGSPPYYSIDGRTSVDILKSGGYKISALQIESVVLEHPAIAEVAVLGVPDDTYGQVVTALVAPRQLPPHQQQQHQPTGAATAGDGAGPAAGTPLPDEEELQRFCRERLAPYQVPKRWQWVAALPRNAMGKVNKKELLKLLMTEGGLPGPQQQ